MTKAQKYLEALKTFDDWVIVSEWATKVGEVYPDLLAEANAQAEKQVNPTTGLRELAARISSRLSSGGFPEVEVDESERPRKVRYISEEDKKVRIEDELEADIEPLTRIEHIRKDTETLGEYERYRIEELETISRQLNKFFSLDFEVDHALKPYSTLPKQANTILITYSYSLKPTMVRKIKRTGRDLHLMSKLNISNM